MEIGLSTSVLKMPLKLFLINQIFFISILGLLISTSNPIFESSYIRGYYEFNIIATIKNLYSLRKNYSIYLIKKI